MSLPPCLPDVVAAHCAAKHTSLRDNECLGITGSSDVLGDWAVHVNLTLTDHGVWTKVLEVPDAEEMQYKYVVLTKPEYEPHFVGNRLLSVAPAARECTVVDVFGHSERSLEDVEPAEIQGGGAGMTLCRFELMTDNDMDNVDHISIIGDHQALGGWREEAGIALEREGGCSKWVAVVQVPKGHEVTYKYVIWRAAMVDICGEGNRHLHTTADGSKLHVQDNIHQLNDEAQPTRVGTAGMRREGGRRAVPVSSLCQFDVIVPGAPPGTTVFILGSHEFLGEWQVTVPQRPAQRRHKP